MEILVLQEVSLVGRHDEMSDDKVGVFFVGNLISKWGDKGAGAFYQLVRCVMSTSQRTKRPQTGVGGSEQSSVANSFTLSPITSTASSCSSPQLSPSDRIDSSFLFKDFCVSYVRHCRSILLLLYLDLGVGWFMMWKWIRLDDLLFCSTFSSYLLLLRANIICWGSFIIRSDGYFHLNPLAWRIEAPAGCSHRSYWLYGADMNRDIG